MPRGGRRKGQAGKTYPNRSDLGNPAAQAAQVTRPPRIRAEGAPTQGLQATPQAAQALPPQVPEGSPPGAAGPFTRPTDRPNEPLTEGLPMGPGRGPEAFPQQGSSALDELRALYYRFPLQELADLIEEAEEEMGG